MNLQLSRDELVRMISKIMNAEGSEEELDELLFKLKEISLLPNVSDLIFFPEKEMSAEEIADAIQNYKPNLLG
ncbi:bacteriocin immunity protein [Chitinimonas sp. PSY-7]|uniref:bacteriocin immunity protein n=1 Tax=Chitinimonas sp. PSY-7 TaxID=3459088 RepID=UPI0040403B19